MQATFGKQVLYIEKFSLYFFKEKAGDQWSPLRFGAMFLIVGATTGRPPYLFS